MKTVWYVKEWDAQEDYPYTEFPTYESAKKYFDHMIILLIKELRNDGMKPDEINEYLDGIRVTENKVEDFTWGMEILVDDGQTLGSIIKNTLDNLCA